MGVAERTASSAELAALLADALLARGWQLGTAESCTGGGLAYRLTAVAGSSRWFAGGMVTYSNRFKQDWLEVDAQLIQDEGAVSEQVARAMAEGLVKVSGVDATLAVTGIAGPAGATATKPVGLVWLATSDPQRGTRTKRLNLSGDREAIRRAAIHDAIKFFLQDLS